MKKRVLSLLLAGMLTAGMLAGCEGGVKTSENPAAAEQQSAAEESGAAEEDGGEQELTTVHILCKNDYDDVIKTENWEQYPISQELISDLEEIGIRLELECIDNESFENVVKTRMASGQDIPDLISYCWATESDVQTWAASGMLYSVDELVEQYDEDGSIRAFYDEMAPGVWESTMLEDGNVYWFTYLMGNSASIDAESGVEYLNASPFTFSIRQDWVEAVGEEVKEVYTPEELFTLLKKMYDEDANGNGVSDEIAELSIDGFNYFAPAFGLTLDLLGGYFAEENEVFSNFFHENFPAYIEFMQRLYQAGVCDTITLNTSQAQLISENRYSMVIGYSVWDYESSLQDVDENSTYYTPIYVDPDGDLSNGFPIIVDSPDPRGYNQYFVPKACENPEAVMKLMDYVYSERYAMLDQYGIEGESYEYDENGNIVMLSKEEEGDERIPGTLADASIGLYALPRMVVYPAVVERVNAGDPPYMQAKQEWRYNFFTELYPSADPVYDWGLWATATDEEAAVISETQNQLETYASELLADLILGNKSLDNLEEYQQELNDLGLQEYLQVRQARRDRILGKTQ